MIEKDKYEKIAKEIHSDTSPVGIGAKKTHVADVPIASLKNCPASIKSQM